MIKVLTHLIYSAKILLVEDVADLCKGSTTDSGSVRQGSNP